MVIDGRSENKDVVTELAKKYGIKRVVVSIDHPQINGIIKYVYKSIVDIFSKISAEKLINWVQNLSAVLWADWSNIHLLTSLILYYIYYGSKPVLFIKLEVLIRQILPENKVYWIANLLAICICQLYYRNNDFKDTTLQLKYM